MSDRNQKVETRRGGEGENRRGHNKERKSPYQEIPNKQDKTADQKNMKANKGKTDDRESR